MPWTRQQVEYLLSDGSPLSAAQKEKMKRELHANPELGHRKKAEPGTRAASEKHQRKLRRGEFKPGGYNWRDYE